MGKARQLIANVSREHPTLSIDARTLPAIKNWKVGNKYRIMLTVEQTSLSKDEWGDGDNQTRARFKILKAKECTDE